MTQIKPKPKWRRIFVSRNPKGSFPFAPQLASLETASTPMNGSSFRTTITTMEPACVRAVSHQKWRWSGGSMRFGQNPCREG
ncbi:hypothetical protein ES288_A12G109900v1 [Gossypium darwinii]|uniref:Uncharacterized protein n=1 Tax=Gossypium darwinii TaxID=34276 RepID=A0A5D2E8G6_GOSDA|nr:hypothetical protein ES288_A12G109900v1 [Gossypium darwinii]